MEATKLSAIARMWIDAMNAHDVEGVLKLYAEDADHISPRLRMLYRSTDEVIEGKDTLRKWFARSFDRFPTLKYELQTITAQAPDRVIIEYKRTAQGEKPTMVAEVFEVNEAGLILHSRVYLG